MVNPVPVIFNIIIYAGIVQGIYSAIVLTHTRLKNPANHYLALLLIVLSFSILHSSFIIPYFHQAQHTNFQIKEPFVLLVVPLIWLYVKKLNEPGFVFTSKHIWHFLPFTIVMLFSIVFFVHKKDISSNSELHSHTFVGNIIIYIITVGQYLFYLAYILKQLRSFRKKAYNELSNTENIDPAWLRIFLFTFLAIFVMLIGMMVIAIHKIQADYFNQLVAVVFAISIFILGFKGLFQQTILPVKEDSLTTDSAEKTDNIEISVDEKLLNRLIEYMNAHKPFVDPELTLTTLASQMNISRNQMSELINNGTGSNFYDFINKFRAEEVKQIMANPKFKDYTLLAIAFEAGFPSKSTFNSIFKKFTGLTPSEYKEKGKSKK